jgi:exodeoxyribonuclease VII large subunit
VGALELAFRQLCEKLAKEGLFDRERKRPLPRYPRRLAIVTSPTGAAIADMLRTIERRYPCVEVFLYPVRVQGAEAAGEIAAAIRGLNANRVALGGMDLMIVGRGGGSLEDLWAFNEEVVARAIFASRIPVISAVGHEVDVTIADLVADVRAATPTAAAEMAVPVLDELLADLAAHELRLLRAAGGRVQILSARLEGIGQRRSLREPMELVRRREQFLDERSARLVRLVVERLAGRRRRLDRLEPIVQRIAPHRLLRQRALSVRDFEHRLDRAMARRLADSERSVLRREEPMHQFSPANLVPRARERAERMAGLLSTSVRHRLTLYGEWLRRQDDLLQAMSYRSVLGRGFSITRAKKGRAVVRSTRELTDGQRLVTEVADGQFESQVVNLRQQELFE